MDVFKDRFKELGGFLTQERHIIELQGDSSENNRKGQRSAQNVQFLLSKFNKTIFY